MRIFPKWACFHRNRKYGSQTIALTLLLFHSSVLKSQTQDPGRVVMISLDGTPDYLIDQFLHTGITIASRSYLRQHKIPVAHSEHNLAHQFRHLLESELKADYGVNHYARKLLTTRVTLNKYCNHVFGVNAGDLIKQRLVFEIKSGLLYTNQTINEIAALLGFREPGNLTRFFKHFTGLTPSGYRKLYEHGLYFR